MIKFCGNILKGILLGAGAILPGISSGVICVTLGIYEKIINSILNIFKDFKNNLKFLFPLAVGCFIGIFSFGNGLNFLFIRFPMQLNYAFMGLILGTMPTLFKNSAKSGSDFKLHYLLYTFITFIISIILINYKNTASYSCLDINFSSLYYALCGLSMSIGIVVPGVSSTVILMILNVYEIYLSSISCLNLSVLIPLGIGLIIGSIFWLKIIQILLKKFNSQTFFAIIGFVFGSLVIMYPGFSLNYSGLISIILFLLCVFTSYYLEQRVKK